MNKRYSILIVVFTSLSLFSQSTYSDYFQGNRTYCEMPDSDRVKEIFPLGVKCIQDNIYFGAALQIFTEIIKIDSTFCDAYFWAGYTLRLTGYNEQAVGMYYIADSLAQNKSIEFKQNLATTSMMVGYIDLSRKKFEEITEHFPDSPEGYYGIALTSAEIGDIDYGLENINIAINKYQKDNKDAQFMKAILLTLNSKHQEAIAYYDKVESAFRRDDYFNGNYALSLYKVSKLTNNERMKRDAQRYYRRVKSKDNLTEYIKNIFEN